MLFDAVAGAAPVEVGRLDLPEGMAIHDFVGDGPHPLDQAKVVLTASAGGGFVRRMASRGIDTVITAETDPVAAVRACLDGAQAPVSPETAPPCGCADH